MSENYHAGWWEPDTTTDFMQGLDLVQVCSRWDDPERLRRIWIMHEIFVAVVNGADINLAMSLSEHKRMADALLRKGPEAILDVVFAMTADPTKASMSLGNEQCQKDQMVRVLQHLQVEAGGPEQMDLKLAEATRKAHATAIESEFYRQWNQDGPSPDVLDLGHHLAGLWAPTDDQNKARQILEKVLDSVKARPVDWNEAKVARLDRTAAALMQLILQQGSEEAAQGLAHEVERGSCEAELAGSLQGLHVSVLRSWRSSLRNNKMQS